MKPLRKSSHRYQKKSRQRSCRSSNCDCRGDGFSYEVDLDEMSKAPVGHGKVTHNADSSSVSSCDCAPAAPYFERNLVSVTDVPLKLSLNLDLKAVFKNGKFYIVPILTPSEDTVNEVQTDLPDDAESSCHHVGGCHESPANNKTGRKTTSLSVFLGNSSSNNNTGDRCSKSESASEDDGVKKSLPVLQKVQVNSITKHAQPSIVPKKTSNNESHSAVNSKPQQFPTSGCGDVPDLQHPPPTSMACPQDSKGAPCKPDCGTVDSLNLNALLQKLDSQFRELVQSSQLSMYNNSNHKVQKDVDVVKESSVNACKKEKTALRNKYMSDPIIDVTLKDLEEEYTVVRDL